MKVSIKKLLVLVFLAGGGVASWYLTRPRVPAAADWIAAAPTRKTQREMGVFSTAKPISSREVLPDSMDLHDFSAPREISKLVQQIQDALHSGDIAERDRASKCLLPELIKMDPDVAATLSESLSSDGPEREEMLRRLAQYWAAADVIGAKNWAEQLPNANERDAALVYVCAQVAQADPQLAVKMADRYGLEKQPDPILEDLVCQWAERDFSSAITWAQARPAGEKKDKMLSRLAVLLAKTSPTEAAQIVAVKIPESAIQTETAISVLYQWTQHDMAGARAWVELFPKGSLRERALKELDGAESNARN